MNKQMNMNEKIIWELLNHISLGLYGKEEKLPSVRELSSHYHVNPNTISKVYAYLEEQGYIYAIQAKGYYVKEVNEDLQEKAKKDIKILLERIVIQANAARIKEGEVLEMLSQFFASKKGAVLND